RESEWERVPCRMPPARLKELVVEHDGWVMERKDGSLLWRFPPSAEPRKVAAFWARLRASSKLGMDSRNPRVAMPRIDSDPPGGDTAGNGAPVVGPNRPPGREAAAA